jgi:DnaJ like chaperone protein
MSWFGKILGGAIGFFMGGPLGAMLGAAMGHQIDQGRGESGPFRAEVDSAEQYRANMAFFTAVFSVMGHLAKVDGRVNELEIAQARRLMGRLQLAEDMRKTAMRLFADGKRANFPFDNALNQFRAECGGRFALIRTFVEFQLELALADGPLNAAEEKLLLGTCERLHFSSFEFHALKSALEAQLKFSSGWGRQRNSNRGQVAPHEPTLEESYAVLGVKALSSADEIRRAYRRLLSQHHPDKLASAGVADEKIRLANEKTQEICRAWEIIRKARKL